MAPVRVSTKLEADKLKRRYSGFDAADADACSWGRDCLCSFVSLFGCDVPMIEIIEEQMATPTTSIPTTSIPTAKRVRSLMVTA